MKSHNGFTLIEILVVIMIIGLMASGATIMMSGGGPKKDLDQAVERFISASHQIGDVAILTGEPMGLVLTPPLWTSLELEDRAWQYTWKRFVQAPNDPIGQWTEVEGIEAMTLRQELELFVQIEGNTWDWKESPISDIPLFVIYPTGESDPFLFEIEFAHNSGDIKSQHVIVDKSGRLEWKEALEAHEELKERFQ